MCPVELAWGSEAGLFDTVNESLSFCPEDPAKRTEEQKTQLSVLLSALRQIEEHQKKLHEDLEDNRQQVNYVFCVALRLKCALVGGIAVPKLFPHLKCQASVVKVACQC